MRSTKGEDLGTENAIALDKDSPCEETIEKIKIPHSEDTSKVSVPKKEAISDDVGKARYMLIDDTIKNNIIFPCVLLLCGFFFFNYGTFLIVSNDMAVVFAWISAILGAATIVLSIGSFVFFLCSDEWYYDRKENVIAKICGTIAMCVICAIGIVCLVLWLNE